MEVLVPDQIRVSIIDDSAADALLLGTLLAQAFEGRIETVHFASAEEAAAVLATEEFDCAFVDYQLDTATGASLLERISEAGCSVPVIAVSGSGRERAAVEMLKLGADDFLLKGELSADVVRQSLLDSLERAAHARALRDQQAELQSFVGVAAHDLATPLHQISGFAQLLSLALADGDLDDAKMMAENIQRVSGRMSTMLRSLLDYARAGRSTVDFEAVALEEAVRAAADHLSGEMLAADAELCVGELPVVFGCRPSLIQLFQNLLGNALKFRKPDVPLRIEVKSSECDAEWTVGVRDNGVGFALEHAARLFKPFERLEPRGRRDGHGIGLATCMRIAQRHGGRIWAESQPGAGSEFLVALPKARAPGGPAA